MIATEEARVPAEARPERIPLATAMVMAQRMKPTMPNVVILLVLSIPLDMLVKQALR